MKKKSHIKNINDVLAEDEIQEEGYPAIIIDVKYSQERDIWADVNSLVIEQQKLISKFFSQWDYQLESSSKNTTAIVPYIQDKNLDNNKEMK